MRDIDHFVNGAAFAGTSGRSGEVYDPNIGEVQAHVALASAEKLDATVRAAAEARVAWATMSPKRRARNGPKPAADDRGFALCSDFFRSRRWTSWLSYQSSVTTAASQT